MKVERREKESGRRGEEKVIAVHGVVYAGGQSHHGDDDGKKGGERERERGIRGMPPEPSPAGGGGSQGVKRGGR